MTKRPGYHLAELNIGRLVADPDSRRVRDFIRSLGRINGLGKRAPGFVWIMEGSDPEASGNIENSIDGDPRFVPNLTVWEDVASLENFVWNTVHRQFYERRAEWFEVLGEMHFVMWWVPEGHRPTLAEAMERLEHLREHGDTDHAFGWAHIKEATARKTRRCKGSEAA